MLSREIKKMIELSGGKIIVSEGNVKESYVVMKLDKHLEELEGCSKKEVIGNAPKTPNKKHLEQKRVSVSGLTRGELLDRINTDIAEVKRMNIEKEVAESFELEDNKKEEEKGEFYYEKVH